MPRNADLLPDWFVGGAGKRRLLEALTNGTAPLWHEGPPWSGRDLARAAALSEKHAVTRHLEILELAHLLRQAPGGWELVSSPLLAPLSDYLKALRSLPADSLPRARGGSSSLT